MSPARADTVRALTLSLAHLLVKPGQEQVLTIRSTPGAHLYLTTTFPDGRTIQASLTLGDHGKGRWSFTQPKSTVMRTSRVAIVTAAYTDDAADGASSLYTVGYGALDVRGQITVDASLAHLEVWAHSAKGASISVTSSPDCGLTPGPPVADRSGWVELGCTVPTPPPSSSYRITASARVGGRSVTARTTLSMPEAAYDSLWIDGLRLLVRQGDSWVPSSSIPLNRMVRLAVLYHATEAAGIWFPACVGGTIVVRRDDRALWNGPVSCPTMPDSAGQSLGGLPYVYLDTSLGNATNIGVVEVDITLEYSSHRDARTFQESVVEAPSRSRMAK